LKAIKKRPGYTEKQIDEEAVLLRAYGEGTEVIIDRERETKSHALLAEHRLAPALLARFNNGLMYRFIRGRVCRPEDLREPPIARAVAREMGTWHAMLPVLFEDTTAPVPTHDESNPLSRPPAKTRRSLAEINAITPSKPTPNIWTVMQKWIFALPVRTAAEKERQTTLQAELKRTTAELGDIPGLGKDGLIFGHCDLLSGNVIILPESRWLSSNNPSVSFIDYEYATPSPCAFDLANHFAEWGGFDCDFSVLPTRKTRLVFITQYLCSYYAQLDLKASLDANSDKSKPFGKGFGSITAPESDFWNANSKNRDAEIGRIFEEVDRFRGVPGLYWGIWALIQAEISQIDFDYASYAEVRLGEYWSWREVESGKGDGGIRERRWAEE
jgi:ethanolamine kinase